MMERVAGDPSIARVGRHPHGALALALLLLGALLTLAACSLPGASNGASASSDAITPAQAHWCDHPILDFQDDSTTSQTIITKWDQVKDQLGFTLYLPASLPKGSCLALAGGAIHDPIYGGHLSVSYVLPTVGAISFSEAPKRANLSGAVQCTSSSQATPTPSATPTQEKPITVCAGTIANTSVTIASRETADQLKHIFGSLQPTQDWLPADTNTLLATPTAGGK